MRGILLEESGRDREEVPGQHQLEGPSMGPWRQQGKEASLILECSWSQP